MLVWHCLPRNRDFGQVAAVAACLLATNVDASGNTQVATSLQGRIDELQAEAAEQARIAALDCARVLKTYGCSWNAYLAANPTVQTWAKANKYPTLVPAEKTRLGAID